ncbi:MAG TPA: response regulator transcription factor [Candidatus Fimimorpha faecalis]|uniref:Stage 0 sporulation protein A homolog n=1 Tax=Candidatus Fimimorpha faecalis TaxID=2840824 RepID=A0A9D1JDE8_9FIRM|nr:response regulator transcription factor [Candidatus Fimimorpha faecalis]
MKHKILIIDDEEMILEMLKKCLEAEDFLVYTANSAKKALEQLSIAPDIILLDINMPEINGFELCQAIRDHITCPILFLTARVTEQDAINGFSVGGDDYITKPFHMDELLARIFAHIRREKRKNTAANIKFDNELMIDYNGRMVFFQDHPLDFSNKEFEIIRLLSQNAGMVFDRETIYEKLWGYDGNGDSIVIKEHIRKIRNKLTNYTNKNYIETVWGVGYKWIK